MKRVGTLQGFEVMFESGVYHAPELKMYGYPTEKKLRVALARKVREIRLKLYRKACETEGVLSDALFIKFSPGNKEAQEYHAFMVKTTRKARR